MKTRALQHGHYVRTIRLPHASHNERNDNFVVCCHFNSSLSAYCAVCLSMMMMIVNLYSAIYLRQSFLSVHARAGCLPSSRHSAEQDARVQISRTLATCSRYSQHFAHHPRHHALIRCRHDSTIINNENNGFRSRRKPPEFRMYSP